MPARHVILASSGLALWLMSRSASPGALDGRDGRRWVGLGSAVSRIDGATDRHPASLRGRVLLPDNGSPLGLRVYVTADRHVVSADVDATGGFAATLAGPGCDSVDMRFDVAGDRNRRYHAAHVRVPWPSPGDAAVDEAIRVVLVPTSFRVEAGTHAGAIIPITVDYAVAGPAQRARYWRVSRSRSGYGIPIGWPADRFPLPLAVQGRSGALRTPDSAAFWAIARQLERDVGQTLFRPMSLDSAGSGAGSVTVSLNPAEGSPGVTFITYDGRGDLFDATIAFRTPAALGDPRIVTHELMHALGFGHVIGWQSVLSSAYHTVPRVTAADVAYAQLLYRIRRMHVEEHATHGILASTVEARQSGTVTGAACSPRAGTG